MFKSNPNFNEYYGVPHHTNRKANKLRRTESSKERISPSKKSFSQDSQSDGQSSLHKRNKNLKDFMNRKNQNHNKTGEKVNSPESPKEQNILDLFKRKNISGQINLRKSVDLYPDTRSKKYAGIDYNQISSKKIIPQNQTHKYQLAEYFGDSFDIKNKRSVGNQIRSRSLRNRNQKSPLRLLKSKSRQQLYSPVEKMLNIIKQQQKVREQKIQSEKTVKHINYFRTLNELNETHMNYPALGHIRSEKNFNGKEIQSHNKKKKLHEWQYNEISNSKNAHRSKQEFSRKKTYNKGLKNSQSEIFYHHVSHRNQGNKKISSSKIKKYFNRKQQMQMDKLKMRNLLESVGTKKEIAELRKIQSEKALMYSYSESNGSQVSQSLMSNNRMSSQKQIQSEQRVSFNSRQNSRYQNGSVYQYSDYGIQVQDHQYKQQIQNKNFYKTPTKINDSYEFYQNEVPQSPAGMMIDQIKTFQNSKFKEFITESEIERNGINSMASIEDKLPLHKQKSLKESQISGHISAKGSKISIKSSECQIHIHSPSNVQYQAQVSINTPAYRHNLTEKKPKQSIISKLKKDIAEDKMKNAKIFHPTESKLSKKQSELLKKDKPATSSYLSKEHQLKKQNSKNFHSSIDAESQNNIKIQSKKVSEVDGLSNLIHSNSDYQISKSPPQFKHKDTWKDNSSNFQHSNIHNEIQEQIQQSAKNPGHELSEFESLASERKNTQKSYQINSMINSNKISQDKSHQNKSINNSSQLSLNKNFSSNKPSKISKKESLKDQKPQEEKKTIKFFKIAKKKDQSSAVQKIPKIQESNIESLTDSYQTDSIASSQTTNLRSSTGIGQTGKFPNSIQKIHIDQSKSKIIREESGSEAKSSHSSSSIEMSSSSSVYTESIRQSQQIKKKISDSEYSQSSQSREPTSNKVKTSKMSQSEQKLNSNSEFSLQISSQNASNSMSKSSSVSSASKKFASANKFNNMTRNDSNMFKKKKNFAQYTLNDVARYIEEHEFRIEAYCFYIDNSKSTYEEDYELQKIQLLSFLMLKKNLYQLKKAILALQGKGQNVFNLSDIQIIDQVLEDYRDREEINQQLNNMIKYEKSSFKEFQQTYQSLVRKYQGEKGFNLSLEKDDFSSEIVKKLGQELNMLYEKWEKNKSHGDKVTARKICERLQKRMIQIIQLIFLTSEIDGKRVKPFQMIESQIEFTTYYQKWYERIIETIEYFDSKSKYSN